MCHIQTLANEDSEEEQSEEFCPLLFSMWVVCSLSYTAAL